MTLEKPSGKNNLELRFLRSDVAAIMAHAKANTTLPDIPCNSVTVGKTFFSIFADGSEMVRLQCLMTIVYKIVI